MSSSSDDTPGKQMLRELTDSVRAPPVDNSIVLRSYFTAAANFKQQAEGYIAEGDDENSYLYLLRFAKLFMDTIKKHNACDQKQYQRMILKTQRSVVQAIDELEKIKPRLVAMYDAIAEQQQKHEASAYADASAPDPDPNPDSGTAVAGAAAGMAALSVGTDDSKVPSYQRTPSKNWDLLKPQASVAGSNGPLYGAPAPPAGAPPRPAGTQDPYPEVVRGQAPARRKPAAPPRAQLTFLKQRRIHCPRMLLNEFLDRYAVNNTRMNKETCGILCGELKNNELYITHVIIPKQEGSSDRVETKGEEELFEYQISNSLLTLGWIHTHPSQTCFLSAVDLHTQYSYQVMMPEALAIVMAPTKQPDRGIFSLTRKGIEILATCSKRGFHQHYDNEGLYGQAQHCIVDDKTKAKFVDLRTT
jgi:STAM-binding protein